MIRFRRTLRHLAAGENVAPIRLRHGDFWKEMANDFNVMLERMAAYQKRRIS
jgi:hypothetical protein